MKVNTPVHVQLDDALEPLPAAECPACFALVPEGRRIFGELSVEENLRLAALTAPRPLELGWIYEVFPRLRERRRSRGGNLSGGEQQVLAGGTRPERRSEAWPFSQTAAAEQKRGGTSCGERRS